MGSNFALYLLWYPGLFDTRVYQYIIYDITVHHHNNSTLFTHIYPCLMSNSFNLLDPIFGFSIFSFANFSGPIRWT